MLASPRRRPTHLVRKGIVLPFKHVRHLLRDAAIGLAWLYFSLGESLRAGWPEDDAGWSIIDATHALDEARCSRSGTRDFLNFLRRRILDGLRKKQALAAANGRHWPLPTTIHFLLSRRGEIKVRACFPPQLQADRMEWVEALQPGVAR